MLTRVVKIHFKPDFIEEFKQKFAIIKPQILNFDGCTSVSLLQHESEACVFFTISIWHSAEHLESYRTSEFFSQTWASIKPNFESKAEAWSLLDI